MTPETPRRGPSGKRLLKWTAIIGTALLAVFFVAMMIFAAVEGDGDEVPSSPTSRAVATETPRATATPRTTATDCPTSSERSYITAIGDEAGTLGSATSSLGELFDLAGQDAYLLYDDDWLGGVALALAFIEGSAQNLLDMSAPTDRTRGIQVQLAAAGTDFLRAVDLVTLGVDNLDADALGRGAELLLSGTDYVLRATELMEALCQ